MEARLEAEEPEGVVEPVPAPPASAASPEPLAEPPVTSSLDAEAIAKLRPPRSRATLIVVGVAIVVALAAAIWAFTGDSPGETPPTKHAY
jgi:hypothetical protein